MENTFQGRANAANARLDCACPVLGQKGRLGPRWPLWEDPMTASPPWVSRLFFSPRWKLFFWDTHIITKMNHTERMPCAAGPPL